MADDKKPELRWEEAERLGPYQLHEQVPQSEHSRGELYRATHETSGAAALVLKPAAADEDGPVPLTDWRVRCISSSAPSYLALEVEHSPWTFDPDRPRAEELVCTFEDVRDGVKRMAHALPDSNKPRPRWRQGLMLAGAATLTLALVMPSATATQASVAQVREQVQVRESMVEAWATDVNVDSVPIRPGEAPRPVRNQKRAPCTAGLEVEVSGACWLSVTQRPCPPQTVTYQDQCLLPVAVPRSPGTSLDGGDVPEPR